MNVRGVWYWLNCMGHTFILQRTLSGHIHQPESICIRHLGEVQTINSHDSIPFA